MKKKPDPYWSKPEKKKRDDKPSKPPRDVVVYDGEGRAQNPAQSKPAPICPGGDVA